MGPIKSEGLIGFDYDEIRRAVEFGGAVPLDKVVFSLTEICRVTVDLWAE